MKVNMILLQHDWKNSFWQLIKFGLVGISNAIVLLSVYYILLFFSFHYILAYIIAFILSVLNAYFWNNRYVFKNSSSTFWHKLIKVYVSYTTTFILNIILLYMWVDIMGLSEKIAPIINIGVTTPLNFMMNKLWAFKI